MHKKILPILAYTGAALTLAVAVSVPLYLTGAFTRMIARAGLHVDASYTGGEVARTIDRGDYRIVVYRPVQPRLFERMEPFVQVAFEPIAALPATVYENLDLDGDGQPDVLVNFARPTNAQQPMRCTVTSLNAGYQSMTDVGGDSLSRIVAQAGDRIVMRIPLNRNSASR